MKTKDQKKREGRSQSSFQNESTLDDVKQFQNTKKKARESQESQESPESPESPESQKYYQVSESR